MLIELYVLNKIVFLPSFISRLAFPFGSFSRISSNSLQSLLIFGNNLFETTFLWCTGELARVLLLIKSTQKNAGVLTRAPLNIIAPAMNYCESAA